MKKIKFPYRSGSHAALLTVVHKGGFWEKQGLDVDSTSFIELQETHASLQSGAVDIVSGQHVSTYGARARGEDVIYLAQSANTVIQTLAVRPESGIERIKDLKGKKLIVKGGHPYLNAWLLLQQQGLNPDTGGVGLENVANGKQRKALWDVVKDGEADGVIMTAPTDLLCKRNGLRLVALPRLPMIEYVSIFTTTAYVTKNEEAVIAFLKGFIEGLAFFKTNREGSLNILRQGLDQHMEVGDEEILSHIYDQTHAILENKPYPTLQAIANVFEEAKHLDPQAAQVNPLTLWDLHYIRQLDDEGFIDRLYK